MNNSLKIPLFPLHTVLFPGGLLPLKIFEPRYLDMVSWCLRHDSGFGVCLIRNGGKEAGEAAETYDVGTLARITDWYRREDGLLGIQARGEQRFRILSRQARPDHLVEAQVSLLPAEASQPLPAEYRSLAELLEHILNQLGEPYRSMPTDFASATWVGHRLAELLPMAFVQRQYLLELDNPLVRLKNLEEVLKTLDLSGTG
jgi:Lon protease-like protein